jgi:hypothetical protein
MVYFNTKNRNLGIFWRALEWQTLVYFMTTCNILWPFGIIYGRLVYFEGHVVLFPILVCLAEKKLATQ